MNIYMSSQEVKAILPLKTEDDYKTIFSIFNKYQDKLISLNLLIVMISLYLHSKKPQRQYGKGGE